MNEEKQNGRISSKTGFTLVELVVVIAILGILAGVAYPVYTGYINRANNAKVLNTLSSILTTCESAAATVGEDITEVTIFLEHSGSGGNYYQQVDVNEYGSSIHRDSKTVDTQVYKDYINSLVQLSDGFIEAIANGKGQIGAFINCEKIPELDITGDLMDTSYYDLYGSQTKYLHWSEKDGWQPIKE